jgi:hypothetical protein
VIPVKGHLTLDGKPFGPANLVLSPVSEKDKKSSSASVDSEGNAVFETYEPGDGLPASEFRVVVVPTVGQASPVPEVYLSQTSSPLVVKVDAQSKELKIDLVSSAGPPASRVVGGIQGASDPQAMMKAMRSQANSAGK